MKRALFISIITISTCLHCAAQTGDVDTIQYNGDVSKFFNLVILSDGYRTNELAQFVTDAQTFSNDFFSEVPYSNYQSYFNVFAIKVPSNQSGASHPGTASDTTEPLIPVTSVDNYFGSTFDQFGIHRLLVATNTSNIITVLADNFPSYDQAIILVNSPHYGGSGGEFPVATLNEYSSEIALHELGHSIAGLKDEYYPGDIYAEEGINMTQNANPSTVRWKNWYGINNIGIHQHVGSGNASSWYKPGTRCKMQTLDSAFCSVCVEGIIERIHSTIDPLISYTPADLNVSAPAFPLTFTVDLLEPSPNTLKRQWTLNGASFASNANTVQLSGSALNAGTNTLSIFIEDTTGLLKVDNHSNMHMQLVTWTIQNNEVGVDISSAVNNIEFSMFPNPATNEIHVEVKTTLREKLKIELYDMSGKRLKVAYPKSERVTISLGDLPPGILIVKLLAGKQAVLSKQIVKL